MQSECAFVTPEGFVVLASEPFPECTEYVLVSGGDYRAFFNPWASEPDYEQVAWACSAVLFFFALGCGAGSVAGALRRAQ